jgi:hypothetical protein
MGYCPRLKRTVLTLTAWLWFLGSGLTQRTNRNGPSNRATNNTGPSNSHVPLTFHCSPYVTFKCMHSCNQTAQQTITVLIRRQKTQLHFHPNGFFQTGIRLLLTKTIQPSTVRRRQHFQGQRVLVSTRTVPGGAS